jgi:hypothetical protein
MNKANQLALIQATNINLIQIRASEISYFSTFFTNFGTQCALIIGFICGCVSQVPGFDVDVATVWVYSYWVTSALGLAGAVHVLVSTIFVSIYGQGFAIRGPLGSMVKAIDGMIQEQKQIVYGFLFTVIFFELSMIGMYFIMMDPVSAYSSAVLSLWM